MYYVGIHKFIHIQGGVGGAGSSVGPRLRARVRACVRAYVYSFRAGHGLLSMLQGRLMRPLMTTMAWPLISTVGSPFDVLIVQVRSPPRALHCRANMVSTLRTFAQYGARTECAEPVTGSVRQPAEGTHMQHSTHGKHTRAQTHTRHTHTHTHTHSIEHQFFLWSLLVTQQRVRRVRRAHGRTWQAPSLAQLVVTPRAYLQGCRSMEQSTAR